MLSVNQVDQFLSIPGIFHRFPASSYVTVRRPLYEMMDIPVASLRVEYPVNFPFVRVIDHSRLHFRWRVAGSRRFIVVEQRDVKNVLFPDRIWVVQYVCIVIDVLTYRVRSCQFVVQLL
jgi:hypothetical protein